MAWGLRLARSKGRAAQPPPQPEPTPEPPQSGPSSEPPEPSLSAPSVSSGSPRSVGVNLNNLRQKLLDLYGQRVSRDDFGAQAADLLVKVLNCNAAALLAYEKRRERLFLVSQVGLNPAAAQVLGGVQGGPGWDIPLRGIQNRRISVIESAHQNPFVPRPLIELSPRRLTIATLPFFHGYNPSGVLVLFANKARGFSDLQLQAAGQALKVCALAFAELSRTPLIRPTGGAVPAAPAEPEPVPASSGVTERQHLADAQEIARLRTAFDESLWQHAKELAETRRAAAEALDAERERSANVQSIVASLEAERDRFATQLAAARAELATLADARAAIEQRTAETRRLQEALDAATSEAARGSAQLSALQQTHAELAAQHEQALQRHAEQSQAESVARQRDAGTITGLRERVAALEGEHDNLLAVTRELRATNEQLVAQLGTVTAEAARLEEQAAAKATAHDVLQAQHAELRAAYEAVMQSAATAEGASTRLQQQLDEQTAALARERDGLREQLAQALARNEDLDQALAATRTERDANVAAAESSATRLSQVEQSLADLRAERDAGIADLQRERDRLASELRMWGEREPSWAAQLAEISARAEAAEVERTRLAKQLEQTERERQAAAEETRRQQEALAEAAQRAQQEYAELQKRHEAIEAAHVALQGDRDQLDALCAALRSEQEKTAADRDEAVAAREQQIAALQAQLEDAVARYEQDTGARSSHAKRLSKERDALTAARRKLEQSLAQQTERVQKLEAELAAAAASQTAVRGDLEQVSDRYQQETAALRQQLADAERALEELRRSRAEVAAERGAANEAAELLQRDVAQLRSEVAAAKETLAQQRSAAEKAEAERLSLMEATRAEIQAGQQQIAERNRELATLQARLEELNATSEQDRAAHREGLERLVGEWESERSTLQARTEELEQELEHQRQQHRALAEALAADESQPALEIERCAIPGADGADESSLDESFEIEVIEQTQETSPANTIAVIDGEQGLPMVEALSGAGWETIACEPTEEAIGRLASQALSGIALNVMAGENGWQLVRSLRNRQDLRKIPLLLYGKQSEGKGFCFGPVDCVLWPNEPQHLLDALARLAPRAKRVLAMSTDIDIVAGVREQLTGAGLSAAVMLDGKQALDLLPSVRPDAAVLHVSPSCVDIFRTIAGLRAHSESLPVILVLDREPGSRDATFLAGGTKILANKGTFSAAGVADEFSRLLSA